MNDYGVDGVDDDFERDPEDHGGEPTTTDADIRIKVGDWIDIQSPKASRDTPRLLGMGFMVSAPGVTLWLGTAAEAPVWVTISVVTIQAIGLVITSMLPRRKHGRR